MLGQTKERLVMFYPSVICFVSEKKLTECMILTVIYEHLLAMVEYHYYVCSY